ncbi:MULTISPECIES: glycosyltransferase family 2 protein [Micromonospora]|uniref:glycosyltransferase family 2 protein n=1 Tax=Micromonospora TaxID=1873 RepID=UPI0009E6DB4C|nr:glycosyltransferase family 2 protein [Micromonospora sp. NRRL B-16802]
MPDTVPQRRAGAPAPSLSVVIPTFRDAPSLELTLRSLTRQTLPAERFEVIVVRDGGPVGAEDYAGVADHGKGLNLRIIDLPDRRGRSGARNEGIRHATADTILFLDSDSYACSGLLERHVAFHAASTTSRVLIGRRNELGRRHLDAVLGGGPMTPSAELRADDGGDLRFTNGMPIGDEWLGAMWMFAYGHNVSVARETVTAVGGFDESFGARWGWEDLEFFYRVDRELGPQKRAFRYDAEALVYHLPHYRNMYQNIQEYTGNREVILAKYRNIDWEFVGLVDPIHSAEILARYRDSIADCLSRQACRIAPAWRWLGDRLSGVRTLWIGTGTGEVDLGDDALTFDYGVPAGGRNYHLVGIEPPIEPGSLDAVVSVDFWRYLYWQELCTFLTTSARLGAEIYLVGTDTELSAGPPPGPEEVRYLARALRHSFTVTVLRTEQPNGPWALHLRHHSADDSVPGTTSTDVEPAPPTADAPR